MSLMGIKGVKGIKGFNDSGSLIAGQRPNRPRNERAVSRISRWKFCAKREGESAVCSSQMRNSPIEV